MQDDVKKALETIQAAIKCEPSEFSTAYDRQLLIEYMWSWSKHLPELRKLEEKLAEEKNSQPRVNDPYDYDRAQPTDDDVSIVREFINREGGAAAESLLGSAFERKMGLLVAAYFNRGFDLGKKSVREENGYNKGFRAALRLVSQAVKSISLPEEG